MNIGGQALIEGVIMRSANYVSVAVRDNKKIIKTKIYRRIHPAVKYKNLFVIRGFLALIDMLVVGTRELLYSAEISSGEKISKKESGFTFFLSILFALALFVALPFYVSKLITTTYWLFNLTEGLIRIIIFIGYVLVISISKDIQRVYQYHGAEHASIACFEAKKELTANNVKKFPTIHPRCGTAFIFIVLIISILVFSFVYYPSWIVRLTSRIILIPIVAGVSYEILKLNAKFKIPILNLFSVPGLWLQKITTKKPNKDQIEVAITSLKLLLNKERS